MRCFQREQLFTVHLMECVWLTTRGSLSLTRCRQSLVLRPPVGGICIYHKLEHYTTRYIFWNEPKLKLSVFLKLICCLYRHAQCTTSSRSLSVVRGITTCTYRKMRQVPPITNVCISNTGIIRESVDSLCRDGAGTPIVRVHRKAR